MVMTVKYMNYDLCIIGGAGHVGLPLGVAFANSGVKTALFDINHEALERIRSGVFPFKEENGNRELKKALRSDRLHTTDSPDAISRAKLILLIIGTPVDEYLNPDFNGFMRVVDQHLPYFKNGQTLILRSTVYPGTSERIQKLFYERGKRVGVAFCPERIVQGKALFELRRVPQIISAFDKNTLRTVEKLFKRIVPAVISVDEPIEAELAKLFSNAWRYIKFAVANQFYMIAADHQLNYHKIYQAMLKDYPRMQDLPSPGFAAGPCLFKDTMQLAAFNSNNFFLGHAAMLVNEGLPNFLILNLKRHLSKTHGISLNQAVPVLAGVQNPARIRAFVQKSGDLKEKTVGILGMAFKAESDDPRDSLSYKLRKIAQTEAKRVLCHDTHIKDPTFVSIPALLRESDIVILAAPHQEYRKINPARYRNKIFVDIWNFWARG